MFVELLNFLLDYRQILLKIFVGGNTLVISLYLLVLVVDDLDIHEGILIAFDIAEHLAVGLEILLAGFDQILLFLTILLALLLKNFDKHVEIHHKQLAHLQNRFLIVGLFLDEVP